ncbi:MAG: glycoside hydrolase family 13 protein [Chloroflexota bacterium]|nr:glycoside hydrolase family 13 protein [Chloroflexota bacterium]
MSERRVYGAQPGTVDTPNWVHDAIFYQIFPDRFAKSDRLDKPHGLEPWGSDPTTYGYKGGDLLGVVEKLDYLQDLGINAIYLNPIFQSASNHRYHTHDYFRVDPLLGGDDAFREMLQACHERGIRVVLDGVFNHASRGFFQFNDALENGRSSPWLDWFTFHNFPLNAYDHTIPPGYSAWVGLHALPKFNTDNPQVREYLMRVGEHWLRQGIDGWRLDVPFEIETPGFWEEFRQRCRAINPNAYLVGEIWRDSRRWLQGDQFDATMNYLFTEAALAFCGRDRVRKEFQDDRSYDPWPGIDGTTYAAKIDHLLGLYDWNVQLAQLNLLDSHDTARALTLLGDDRRSLELATLLLFTFPGAPSIYYGDEIGLDGGLPDQWARKTFPWKQPERWDRDLHGHYKRLIGLRTASPALRSGTYRSLAATAGSYAFARALGTEQFIVALNTSDGEDLIDLGDPRIDGGPLLTVGDAPRLEQQESTLSLNLPARSGVVYRSPRDSEASSNA